MPTEITHLSAYLKRVFFIHRCKMCITSVSFTYQVVRICRSTVCRALHCFESWRGWKGEICVFFPLNIPHRQVKTIFQNSPSWFFLLPQPGFVRMGSHYIIWHRSVITHMATRGKTIPICAVQLLTLTDSIQQNLFYHFFLIHSSTVYDAIFKQS